jgi:hypothetical protein
VRFFPVLCLTLLAACLLPLSQHGAPEPTLTPNSPFDSYGNICWKDEQARLDSFALQLQNYPTASGEIFVYAGRQSCPSEAKYRGNRARNWVLKRGGLDTKRVVVIDAGFQRDVFTYLIIRPKGADPYDVPSSLSKEEVSIKRCVDKVFARVVCLDAR